MEPVITAPLEVSREIITLICDTTQDDDDGFLSVSVSKGVVHVGTKGIDITVFKSASRWCNVSLPEEYVVSVLIRDLKAYVRNAGNEIPRFINLGNLDFLPRLRQKGKYAKRPRPS